MSLFGDYLNENDDFTLEDTLADDEDFVEDMVERENSSYKSEKIKRVLSALNERDRLIIEYLYGFKTGKPMKQNDIAELLNISQAQISRTDSKLRERLAVELDDLREDYIFSSDSDSNIERI